VTDSTTFRSFAEFWPYYVREHDKAATRRWHFCGTTIGIGILVVALVIQRWWLLVAVPIAGYGLAWVSHFAIEKNRPATFKYPLWSLRGDLKMWWLMLTGRMGREVEKCSRVEAPPHERDGSRDREGR